MLLDLGSHLVDQALTLFGPATHVYAEIASRRGGAADDDVFIALQHAERTLSHLHASLVTPSPGPRLRVQGSSAGFLVPGLDPQEAALRAGDRPDTVEVWGMPAEWEHGRLVAGDQSVPVPPVPGAWPRFYELLRDALRDGGRTAGRSARRRPDPPDPGARASGVAGARGSGFYALDGVRRGAQLARVSRRLHISTRTTTPQSG